MEFAPFIGDHEFPYVYHISNPISIYMVNILYYIILKSYYNRVWTLVHPALPPCKIT